MSAESYYTTIKPDEMLSESGVPRYRMQTQSYPEEVLKTETELRKELTREGRIYQPIRWAGRVGFAVGIIYAIAGATGHTLPGFTSLTEGANTGQIIAGTVLWLSGQGTLDTFGNKLSSWESKKHAFERTFSGQGINLIPERFHPSNLFSRFHSSDS